MLRILHDTKYDFIKYWRTAVAATVAFIVLGVAFMGYHKARTGTAVNYSIEFLGGTSVQLHFTGGVVPADAGRSAGDKAGFEGSQIAAFGGPSDFLVKVPPKQGVAAAANADSTGQEIVNALKQTVSGNPAQVVYAESVGASVGCARSIR